MEFFVYGRDWVGAGGLKGRLTGEHWDFMDGYGEVLVARGPTLTGQGDEAESTGSMHIVELPDVGAARAFAYEEPYYLGGVFESVLLCGFRNLSERTMWDFADAVDGYGRFLVIRMDTAEIASVVSKHVVLYGELLELEGEARLGWAALVEAPDMEAAAAVLPGGDGRTEVHHWCFGGRSS
ncbi:YciI family protein [Kribbella qitaiheensis]|uniref:YciI family protein n=1 Tax=Kribbella qitaiheensis TaxID=1544730 RepID=UPI003610D9CF